MRTLSLKRETLTELTPGELSSVVGGSHLCATETIGHGSSFEEVCAVPTTPVNDCLSLDCFVIVTLRACTT